MINALIDYSARNRFLILLLIFFATAWGVQLPLDDPADYQLMLFISRYRQGPQTPEPSQPCAGGVGSPKLR